MTEDDFDQLKEEWTFLEGCGVSHKIENQAENLDLGWMGKNKAAEPGLVAGTWGTCGDPLGVEPAVLIDSSTCILKRKRSFQSRFRMLLPPQKRVNSKTAHDR